MFSKSDHSNILEQDSGFGIFIIHDKTIKKLTSTSRLSA